MCSTALQSSRVWLWENKPDVVPVWDVQYFGETHERGSGVDERENMKHEDYIPKS